LPEGAEGILVRLWCVQWLEGSLPSDIAELARKTRVKAERMEKHAARLLPFFVRQRDGSLVSERMERERQKSGIVSKARRKAANARWNKAVNPHASANDGADGDAKPDANGDPQSTAVRVNVKIRDQNQSSETAVAPKDGAPLALRAFEPTNRKRRDLSSQEPSRVALPDWLPREPWDGFVEMRRKIKKPLTDRGILLAIKKLAELRAQGQDVTAVLDKATLNCWAEPWGTKAQDTSGPRATPAIAKPEPKLEWEVPPDLDREEGPRLWRSAMKELSQHFDRHSFTTWFARTTALGLSNGVLFVQVPSSEFREVLDSPKYRSEVERLIPAVTVQYVATLQEVRCA
jgi:uncharacterized protein YdaU (DUF1376 family)